MIAVFKSKCPACGEWIMPGDEIELVEDHEFVHKDCAETDDGYHDD